MREVCALGGGDAGALGANNADEVRHAGYSATPAGDSGATFHIAGRAVDPIAAPESAMITAGNRP